MSTAADGSEERARRGGAPNWSRQGVLTARSSPSWAGRTGRRTQGARAW